MQKLFSSTIKFWLLWILASSIGFAIGFTIEGGLWLRLSPGFGNNYLLLLIPVVIPIGLFMGLGQSIVLHMRLGTRKTWLWIPATAIGVPLGFSLMFPLGNSIGNLLPSSLLDYPWLPTFIAVSVAGICIGTLQWLAIYRKFKDLLGWILLSALSWGAGMTIAVAVDFKLSLSDINPWYLRNLIFGMLIGAVVGAINGVYVVYMSINSGVQTADMRAIDYENAS